MLRPNRSGRPTRFGARFGAIVAAAVAAAAVSAGDASARDGDCKYDVKQVSPKSSCLNSIWCGGTGSIGYGGVTVRSKADGSIQCCLTEVVEPAHTDIVGGNKKIVHVADVQGTLITRHCTSPVVLFWIDFGSWECGTDTISPFGKYSIDRAEDCD
jgi:hypothetical protein